MPQNKQILLASLKKHARRIDTQPKYPNPHISPPLIQEHEQQMPQADATKSDTTYPNAPSKPASKVPSWREPKTIQSHQSPLPEELGHAHPFKPSKQRSGTEWVTIPQPRQPPLRYHPPLDARLAEAMRDPLPDALGHSKRSRAESDKRNLGGVVGEHEDVSKRKAVEPDG